MAGQPIYLLIFLMPSPRFELWTLSGCMVSVRMTHTHTHKAGCIILYMGYWQNQKYRQVTCNCLFGQM